MKSPKTEKGLISALVDGVADDVIGDLGNGSLDCGGHYGFIKKSSMADYAMFRDSLIEAYECSSVDKPEFIESEQGGDFLYTLRVKGISVLDVFKDGLLGWHDWVCVTNLFMDEKEFMELLRKARRS
ncbi:hypothetical protein CMI46_00350 [Candidatus Pacearchaeota archaeon]|nr:hypothetical protein [Candidatus Pacearchaeota archaeon]